VGISAVLKTIKTPMDALNMGIASATKGIATALPSFPAATMGSIAVGLPHAHPPIAPLPPIGMTLYGCCVSVLIGGKPAARVGDLGLSPTCLGPTSGFAIFTGSSNVFIGGARAARTYDVTMHCWPPKGWMARGAIATLVKAANTAQKVMGKVGDGLQVIAIAADVADVAINSKKGDSAMASANALSAGMRSAQMTANAVAKAAGAIIGKVPGIGPPTGMIVSGNPQVLIGGFPMPSGMQLANRKLGAAKTRKRRGAQKVGPKSCP
jgi:uncharacterized Zn-binding protein involved in type VI secretion